MFPVVKITKMDLKDIFKFQKGAGDMAESKVRRQSEPIVIKQLWAAINYIRQQKQIANMERICKFMSREYMMGSEDVERHLEQAVADKLIDSYTAVAFKGSRVGMEQEGFRIPDVTNLKTEVKEKGESSDHDWYCFECHKPGKVKNCSGCWRVFHPSCIKEEITPTFRCSVCERLEVTSGKPPIKKKQLNKLLGYTVNRLKEKTRELHNLFTREGDEAFDQLVFMSMDLNTMENKCRTNQYSFLEEFHTDALTIYHNVVICYDYGAMAELVRIMIKDCEYDLDEIQHCRDCYHFSNAKPKDWFCQPCQHPHELVFAKQKGYCYWPAKIIRVTEEGNDVRFFGGYHQRAVIPPTGLKPIDTNLKTLNIKKTPGFNKAMDELKRHQALLEEAKQKPPEEDDTVDDEQEEEADFDDDETETEAPKKEETIIKSPPRKRRKKEKKEVVPKKKKKPGRPRKEVVQQREVEKMEESLTENEADEGENAVISSSSHATSIKNFKAATPEDANLVTSSEDNIQSPRTFSTNDTGTQTSRKLLHPGKAPHKATQTDLEVASTSCNCEQRFNDFFAKYKQEMASAQEEKQDKALKELADRLQKDFEEDKQQAVSRAMSNVQREVERARRQAEERCKEQYMEEMKKLAQKHKAEISSAKKKQWCYNCEEEAMYHCCWNTSYCSIKCQQEHWHREHKRMCRRKR